MTLSRLAGIDGEGQLTGALKKCRNGVVLLDEFEKAHPKAIPDVFLVSTTLSPL